VYSKSQDKFSATKHTLHIVKIYQKGIFITCTKLEKRQVPPEAMVKSVTDSLNQILLTILHWMTEKQKFVTVQEDGQKQ
jgi:hypothetical protein